MNIITNDKTFYAKLAFDSVIYNNSESFKPCNSWNTLSVADDTYQFLITL